jgi:hypothetical protein
MGERVADEEAQESLANMLTRLTYQSDSGPMFCELFMMPVVTSADCGVIGNSEAWLGVRDQFSQTLGSWFVGGGKTSLFDGIYSLDWITAWTPKVLRSHLARLTPGGEKEKIRFVMEDINLPSNAPRLGFIAIGRSTNKGWRELPGANDSVDGRLKDIVKYCLQMQGSDGESESAPLVLTPDRLPYAITDGISLWLHQLHAIVGIDGWTVAPSSVAIDVVKVTLKLNCAEVPLTQFLLKLHQIGPQGIQDVLTVLGLMAPMLDKPADMSDSQLEAYKRTGLDRH